MTHQVVSSWQLQARQIEKKLLAKTRIEHAAVAHSTWEGRTFIPSRHEKAIGGLCKIRVLSYNISADCKYSGINCDYTTVNDTQRRWLIICDEIQSYDPDVILLQDVDLFKQFWQPQLMIRGFDCCYKKRSEARGRHEEGVAIAYKRDLFQLFKTDDVELNDAAEHERASISVDLRDKCINDDVAMIALLQPWPQNFLRTAICVVSAMFCDLPEEYDVRIIQASYLATRIERANSEFQLPVFLGITLNDEPSSPAYHLLRTGMYKLNYLCAAYIIIDARRLKILDTSLGRVQLRQEAPRKCLVPRVVPTSRGSVKVFWKSPYITIADPSITSYVVAFRPGGSRALSYRTQRQVNVGDCIQYISKIDSTGITRTVPLVSSCNSLFISFSLVLAQYTDILYKSRDVI